MHQPGLNYSYGDALFDQANSTTACIRYIDPARRTHRHAKGKLEAGLLRAAVQVSPAFEQPREGRHLALRANLADHGVDVIGYVHRAVRCDRHTRGGMKARCGRGAVGKAFLPGVPASVVTSPAGVIVRTT